MLSASFLQSVPFDFLIQGSDGNKFSGPSNYFRRLILDFLEFIFLVLGTTVPNRIPVF